MSPTRPAGGLGSWICTSSMPRAAGQVLDVDHVDRACAQVRLEQLDRRQAQQRVHVLGGFGAAGAKGDRLVSAVAIARPAARRCAVRAWRTAASSAGRSSLIPPAFTAPRISPLLEIRDDRLAGIDADGRLRFVGAGAQVRREDDIFQPEERMILGRRLGLA